jgi:hypothetical protein
MMGQWRSTHRSTRADASRWRVGVTGTALLLLLSIPGTSAVAGAPPQGELGMQLLAAAAASGSVVHVIGDVPEIDVDDGRSDVLYLRGARSGTDWAPRRSLARAVNEGWRVSRRVEPLALAAEGPHVVALWLRTRPGPCGDAGCPRRTLQLRWSENRGLDWSSPRRVPIAPTRSVAAAILDGRLLIAWTHRASGDVRVIRSRDGGQTFGKVRRVGSVGRCVGRCEGHPTFASTADRVLLTWHGDTGARRVRAAWSDAQGRFDEVVLLPGPGPAAPFRADARGDVFVVAYRAESAIHVTRSGRAVTREVVASDTPQRVITLGDVELRPGRTVLAIGRAHRDNGRERIGTLTRSGGAWGPFVPLPWSSGANPSDASAPTTQGVPAGLSFLFEQRVPQGEFGPIPRLRWLLLEDG